MCDFVADSATIMATHSKSVHTYTCNKCEYETNNIEDLDGHKKKHETRALSCISVYSEHISMT